MKFEYENCDKLNSIEVTLAMGCKLNCRYCPQKLLMDHYFAEDSRRLAMMDFEAFKQILSNVKQGGTVCFSGMCEAFLNPVCDDMIVYAYEKGYRISLLTTLTGFRRESIKKLKNVVFDEITLHIPDQEGHSKFKITDEYLENLKLFQENFEVSNYSCHGNVHPAVQQYIDANRICSGAMNDRAGNLDCGTKSSPKGEVVCMVGTISGYGNWTPEILPDGTVLLCCMDYGMKHVLGNLLTMSVREILDGAEYQKVRQGMKDDRIDILCRKCISALEIGKTPAYKFKQALQKFAVNGEAADHQQRILKLFTECANVCVFGMGKLFWDNFFNQKWDEVLGQSCYCDNSSSLWGRVIEGKKCISPEELAVLEKPLIITHMTDDKDVESQLKNMGIENIINIKEIYKAFR